MRDRPADFTALENVTRVTPLRRGVELEIDAEYARFEFVRSDVMRIKISQGGKFEPKPSAAVICDEFGTPAFKLRDSKNTLAIQTKNIVCKITKKPFSFSISRTDGTPIFRTAEKRAYCFLNDAWIMTRDSSAKDAYFGFGEKTSRLDQNGRYLQMWNSDVLNPSVSGDPKLQGDDSGKRVDQSSTEFDPYYMSIPFYYRMTDGLASGSFIDNPCHLYYDLRNDKTMSVRADCGQYTEYVIAGPSIHDILRAYNLLTGMPFTPPLWTLGHHQCRWYPYDDKSIRGLAADYRAKKIPCDALWFDIHYMDGYRVFTWDKKRYPDPEKTLSALSAEKFHTISAIDPGVKYEPGNPVYDEGRERDLFCRTASGQTYLGQVWPGLTAFPDFAKEEARRWWGRLNAGHIRRGIAGIWNDMNEPATGCVDSSPMLIGGKSHEYGHNSYAMLMAMGTADGIREALPGRRTFILSRAGSAGIQRYAANWTGDNFSRWDHLAMSVYMNMNLSLSGQPFCGSDIGGFCDESNGELLTRWYQYGAFQPFMRNHNCFGRRDQYPWSFGKKYEKIIRGYVELRYRMLPYIYTEVMRYPESGVPLQRPLVFDYQSDAKCRGNSSDFMFGGSMLVAPVTGKGIVKRKLYLPRGEWYDFRNDTLVSSKGGYITADAPLESIPVFVKAGAVIPLAPVRQSTMETPPDTVTFKVFVPSADGKYVSYYYEDDGLTDAHLNGAFRMLKMTLERKKGRLVLSFEVSGDSAATARNIVVKFAGADMKDEKIINSGDTLPEISRRF